ncbi:MAG: tagF1 [Phycisphaerales bacterium]|nr:tagF1 [Phycisphaerales bacterium]
MSDHPRDPTLGIVTPTFRRRTFLRRFLNRLLRQTYPHWRAAVVHDGPSTEMAALVAQYAARDPRITYMQLEMPTNDTGVSPRQAGAAHLARLDNPPDYCIFWDDDNYFVVNALQNIAAALLAAGLPDLLLVGMEYRSRILPPSGVPVAALVPGQVDSANLVIRPQLALAAYSDLLEQKARFPEKNLYTSDYMVFDYIRRSAPAPRIDLAPQTVIGFHDGLRWKPYLRHLLGIPPLNLTSRRWFRAATLGLIKPR